MLPAIKNKRVVQVALFLHDIGKGRVEDHSIVGARIARQLCPRFGLNEAETETVAWLIEHHLLMSVTSQTRDIGDPRTIRTFAGTVQSLENLRLLLALTVCDIRAVAPASGMAGKASFCGLSTGRRRSNLPAAIPAVDRAARVEAAREALRAQLPDFSKQQFKAFSDRHYPPYWLKVDPSGRKSMPATLPAPTRRANVSSPPPRPMPSTA